MKGARLGRRFGLGETTGVDGRRESMGQASRLHVACSCMYVCDFLCMCMIMCLHTRRGSMDLTSRLHVACACVYATIVCACGFK